MTGLAQARGFGWALWEINSRAMGIQRTDDADRIDPLIVEALGMSG